MSCHNSNAIHMYLTVVKSISTLLAKLESGCHPHNCGYDVSKLEWTGYINWCVLDLDISLSTNRCISVWSRKDTCKQTLIKTSIIWELGDIVGHISPAIQDVIWKAASD